MIHSSMFLHALRIDLMLYMSVVVPCNVFLYKF